MTNKLNSRSLALLELAFGNEITAAMGGGPSLMQTKSKLAHVLVTDGLLATHTEIWHGVTIKGYVLTEAGRFEYCSSCSSIPEEQQ